MTGAVRVGVAVKAAPRRVDVDPLTGDVTSGHHPPTLGQADRAAIEVALRLAGSWDATEIVVATAAGPDSEPAVREALAMGATHAIRVPLDPRPEQGGTAVPGGPAAVRGAAHALAPVFTDCDVVVCGDASADGGTGAVPALLAAELGRPQCLGLVGVVAGGPGEVIAERRLDRGRRERARATTPVVVSVEPGAARPRRAALPGVLAADTAVIEVRRPPRVRPADDGTVRVRPYRPRPRALPGPDPALPPRDRVERLVGALADREPPRHVDAAPGDAAREIVDQLRTWGYL